MAKASVLATRYCRALDTPAKGVAVSQFCGASLSIREKRGTDLKRSRKMHYPLVFGFGGLVAGKGFVAGVGFQGRALVEEEAEETWIFGVNPGGVAADGPTRGEAFQAFKEACRSVVLDLAEVSGSFEEFKAGVERFFHETNEPTREEWEKAVQEVRNGRLTVEGLEKQVGSADRTPSVVIELVAAPASSEKASPKKDAVVPSPAANELHDEAPRIAA
jgi:hypothetical protein